MKYADIYWADLVSRGGREQFGLRPCVIWHDLNRFQTSTVVVVPLTSQLNALKLPATFLINPTTGNGLSAPSVALIFQLVAVDKKKFGDFIGRLDDPDLLKIADLARQLQRL